MRLLSTVLAAALLLPQGAPAQAPGDSAFVRENYVKHEYRITMRDGVRLFTILYVPRDASPSHRYGIVLQRTPFGIAPYGPDQYAKRLPPNPYMQREKYIFAYQDVRGRYMSEGEFVNARPFVADSIKAKDPKVTDEASDAYDTIDWLVKNAPANNGRVAMWGISYAGFYASMGALSRHPALVAVSPQAPVTDFYFEDFHHNGALTEAYFYAYPIFDTRSRPGPTPDNWWMPEFVKVAAMATTDDYNQQLALGPQRNTTARFWGHNSLWQDIITHPDYDAFWQSRAVTAHLRGITSAVLVVGGWFDAEDLYGPFAVYGALTRNDPQAKTTIVVGPFRHGGWGRTGIEHTVHGDLYFGDSLETKYQRDIEAPWFRAQLEGEGRSTDLPRALMFDTGRKQWDRFASWPAPGAQRKELYFHADGSLSFARPADARASLSYPSDPMKPVPSRCAGPTIEDLTLYHYMSDDQRCFSTRPDVLTFVSDTLRSDVTIGGELTAKLRVSTTGTDADFVVKLIDVYPADTPDSPYQPDTVNVHMAGYQQLVRGEIMRGRYRDSFAKPRPFTPGKVTDVDFRLGDVLHTFRAGHRIMVQVQSSWFPAFDRNPQTFVPNIYEARQKDFIKATQTLWLDSAHASGLVVQVLP